MKFDVNLQSPPLSDVGQLAATAESFGFDGAWITEVTHSPFSLLTKMADETTSIEVGSAITVAFPRSPMVAAYSAWDIQSFSHGRLLFGLGTQVKGHMERRFDIKWASPGPRIRDYIRAIKAIWQAWSLGDNVDYDGQFYTIDHCPPEYTPESINDPDIPIYLAGVNPFNLKVAGELCDGLHIHPVHSPKYIDDVVIPNVKKGANHGERSIEDITLAASVLAVIGESEKERAIKREQVRKQIAFYGSTRTYKTIFEVHGWEDICDDLHKLSMDDRWDDMASLVTDSMIDKFAVVGSPNQVREKIERRYNHLNRISIYEPFRGEDYWSTFCD